MYPSLSYPGAEVFGCSVCGCTAFENNFRTNQMGFGCNNDVAMLLDNIFDELENLNK